MKRHNHKILKGTKSCGKTFKQKFNCDFDIIKNFGKDKVGENYGNWTFDRWKF